MRTKLIFGALALSLALPAAAALAPGSRAPDFTAQGAMGGKPFTVNLKRVLGRGPAVLYFFPAAFTPGCNVEAKAFADAADQFKAAGATVIGMTAGNVEQLERFSSEHCAGKFAVAGASDAVIRGYDVRLKNKDGTPAKLTDRTSYVIAPNGKILFAHSEMSPANHVRLTLDAVRKYQASRKRR